LILNIAWILIDAFQLSLLSAKRSTLGRRTSPVVPRGHASLLAFENGSIDGVTLGASVMASFAWILLLTDEGIPVGVISEPHLE